MTTQSSARTHPQPEAAMYQPWMNRKWLQQQACHMRFIFNGGCWTHNHTPHPDMYFCKASFLQHFQNLRYCPEFPVIGKSMLHDLQWQRQPMLVAVQHELAMHTLSGSLSRADKKQHRCAASWPACHRRDHPGDDVAERQFTWDVWGFFKLI